LTNCPHSLRLIPIAANTQLQHTTDCQQHDTHNTQNNNNNYVTHIITTTYKNKKMTLYYLQNPQPVLLPPFPHHCIILWHQPDTHRHALILDRPINSQLEKIHPLISKLSNTGYVTTAYQVVAYGIL